MTWRATEVGGVTWLRFSGGMPPTANYRDIEELESSLQQLGAGCRVVVIAAENDEFIRHAALDDLDALRRRVPTSGDGSAWGRVLRILDKGPALSIALLKGDVWGGGAELALSCTMRWMATDATIGFPEVRLGIVPGVGAHRVARLLPEHLALQVLSGLTPLTAETAVRWLLVNGACAPDEIESHVGAIASELATLPAHALDAVRAIVWRSRDDDTRTQQRAQLQDFMTLLDTAEAGSLVTSAIQKYASGATSREAVGFPDA